VSNTFVSALWALDTMFAMARAGVDGVNIHTFQKATYRLFRMEHADGRWRGIVAPEYYGLLLFAQAAPPGSRLLGVSGGAGNVRAWATRARDGTIRVVLINDSLHQRAVVLREPVPARWAAYEALRAPGLGATHGISLGGADFGAATETGILPGPRRIFVRGRQGVYALRLPAASAIMLTVPMRSRPTEG
jgi:hypothetical protein